MVSLVPGDDVGKSAHADLRVVRLAPPGGGLHRHQLEQGHCRPPNTLEARDDVRENAAGGGGKHCALVQLLGDDAAIRKIVEDTTKRQIEERFDELAALAANLVQERSGKQATKATQKAKPITTPQ